MNTNLIIGIIIIILLIIVIIYNNNIEYFITDVEAVANVASLYNSQNFTVSNLKATNNLDILGETKLNNNLNVSGITQLNNNLNVSGTTKLNNNLTVSGTTQLNNNLTVSGDVNMQGNIKSSNKGFVYLYMKLGDGYNNAITDASGNRFSYNDYICISNYIHHQGYDWRGGIVYVNGDDYDNWWIKNTHAGFWYHAQILLIPKNYFSYTSKPVTKKANSNDLFWFDKEPGSKSRLYQNNGVVIEQQPN